MNDHVPADLLIRYAGGDPQVGADLVWAVEAHLESCASCRDRLGAAVAQHSPATVAVLSRVHTGVTAELTHSARMPPRRNRLQTLTAIRWATPGMLPRLAVTVLMVLVALGLDLIQQLGSGRLPSLVLLLAPVAPLLGVAASWSRGLDPAYELVVGTPRAGLYLVLRRTVTVLLAVIPVLAVAGWLVGMSPARWLLPCLALTVTALGLGEVLGLHRAAIGLGVLWTVGVVGPSLLTATSPVLLEPAAVRVWAGLTAAVAIVIAVRRDAYTELASTR